MFDSLRDYGYVVLEPHRNQLDTLTVNFQEEFTCQYTFLHEKKNKSTESEHWWKRAEYAVRLVRTSMYTFCFDGLPVETVAQGKVLYEAIKQCAVALDEDILLHLSCAEVVDLALSNFKPSDSSIACAERTQRDILSKCCATFLVAAATKDTIQIELSLAAMDVEKRAL